MIHCPSFFGKVYMDDVGVFGLEAQKKSNNFLRTGIPFDKICHLICLYYVYAAGSNWHFRAL